MLQIGSISSIQNFMNTMKMQAKWQQRKANPFMKKGNEEEDPQITQLRENAEQVAKNNVISSIDGKLKAGQKLSSEELEYLKANCPELYEEAVKVQQEREQYEKKLKRCKTKEEVQKLHMQTMQNFLSATKAISNNPNIPLGKKQELLDKVTRRVMAINDQQVRFVRTQQYQELPEDLEEVKEGKKKIRRVEQDEEKDDMTDLFDQLRDGLDTSELDDEFRTEGSDAQREETDIEGVQGESAGKAEETQKSSAKEQRTDFGTNAGTQGKSASAAGADPVVLGARIYDAKGSVTAAHMPAPVAGNDFSAQG